MKALMMALFLPVMTAPALAFDDDSRDDTRSPVEIQTICASGRTVTDSADVKTSCEGDTVYVNRRNTGLFKNETRLNRQPITAAPRTRRHGLTPRTISSAPHTIHIAVTAAPATWCVVESSSAIN